MLKKLRKWVKENCPSPIAPLVILLLIAIIMVGFEAFALVKQDVTPPHSLSENLIFRHKFSPFPSSVTLKTE